MGNSTPCKIVTPKNFNLKLCIRDYVGDGLVNLYNDTIGALLDRQVPLRTKTCRRRPSNPWFDHECRTAKRSLRSLERTVRRSGPLASC